MYLYILYLLFYFNVVRTNFIFSTVLFVFFNLYIYVDFLFDAFIVVDLFKNNVNINLLNGTLLLHPPTLYLTYVYIYVFGFIYYNIKCVFFKKIFQKKKTSFLYLIISYLFPFFLGCL